MLLSCFAEFFSVSRPKKFELLSLCPSKGGHRACVTTFESNFVGRSIENIQQSKIKAPLYEDFFLYLKYFDVEPSNYKP